MAKIVDPDDLTQGTEVEFLSGSRLIRLNTAGNLSTDGVAMQALYSFIKEEWRTDDNLIKFPIPMLAITSEQFELVSGWDLSGSFSKYLIRDGGWALKDTNGDSNEEWMNLTTLGSFVTGSDQAYFLQLTGSADTPVNFQLSGEVNQGVQIFGSASEEGDFDYRTNFKVYLREQGKTYDFYDLLTEQNLTELTYRKFALPLSNTIDLKISATDTSIETGSTWANMTITYYTESQLRSIGGVDYPFKVIINGDSKTAEEIYEWVQYQLRETSSIDSGTNLVEDIRGDIAEELLEFIGDTLQTKFVSFGNNSAYSGGVFIDNFSTADTNRLEFTDDSGSVRTFPFVAAGTLEFNDNLTGDSNARYFLFFTNDDAGDNTGRDFGTENAIIINDNSGPSPITGSVNGSSSIAFDYDYDGNIQRGSDSSGSNAPYTAIALGLSTAQYVSTVGAITRSTSNTVNFVAALERNYLNP